MSSTVLQATISQTPTWGELLPICINLAKEIINNGPLALDYAIEAINRGMDQALDGGLHLEAELFGKACSTEDSKEGTKAFLEKRKANFKSS